MAKHNGITIRIGAAYDQVEVRSDKLDHVAIFDRSAMRKDGKPHLQGELRRTTVEVWTEQRRNAKGKRANRVQSASRDKARREYA